VDNNRCGSSGDSHDNNIFTQGKRGFIDRKNKGFIQLK